jgi:hypothetical protein
LNFALAKQIFYYYISWFHFTLVILEIGSCELFAQAGHKQWSSWSLPPK